MNARPTRVSIVLHSFDRGGSGRVAGYLARGFAEHGLDVDLIVVCRGGDADGSVEALVGDAVPIRYLGAVGRSRPLDLVRGLPRLARALRARRPDVVIAAANNIALATAAAVRLARLRETHLFIKTTNPIAGSRHRGGEAALRRLTYGWVFRRAQGVWTLSAEERAAMAAAFPHHAALFRDVLNPYVTDAMLAPVSAPSRDSAKRIICVARLTVQKRLERLLRAFAEVDRPDVQLLILGEGEERPLLQAIIDLAGLNHRVAMPGHVEDVASALQASDLLVLTSDYEGLPAVVLEAMATDCPILSTDCFPAARALLAAAPGCGIIEDWSARPLARQIEARLDLPRPSGLHAVAARYSIPSGVRSHLDAMGQISADRRSPEATSPCSL